jgi:flagellar basal-body rod protein FlgF
MAGQVVLGEGGSITMPQGKLFSVTADGTILASSPTNPSEAPAEVAKLLLRDASETTLVRRPDGLFEPSEAALKGQDFDTGPQPVSVRSGALEGSTVSVINTMVKMMDFTRQFEMQIKMIKEIQGIDKSGSSMMKIS